MNPPNDMANRLTIELLSSMYTHIFTCTAYWYRYASLCVICVHVLYIYGDVVCVRACEYIRSTLTISTECHHDCLTVLTVCDMHINIVAGSHTNLHVYMHT